MKNSRHSLLFAGLSKNISHLEERVLSLGFAVFGVVSGVIAVTHLGVYAAPLLFVAGVALTVTSLVTVSESDAVS